jgi:DNA-binding response OmpR family regulator
MTAYATRSPVVLVAEDDPSMRRLLTIALARDGFSVLDASNGSELDKWISRLIQRNNDHRCVDLIIADQRMPAATGLEVLAHLRHADWSTPFILITAFGDTATHAEAERLGASCVLDKPFDLNELVAAALQFAMPGDKWPR